MELTTEAVKGLFDYRNGQLFRKSTGKLVGKDVTTGYAKVYIGGKYYSVHRVVWLWFGNSLPKVIDHINGCKTDNRIENLRCASQGQNRFNSRLRSDNTSGIKGVTKSGSKWRVEIWAKNQYIYVGTFKDLELAEQAAVEARNNHHGEFANHG